MTTSWPTEPSGRDPGPRAPTWEAWNAMTPEAQQRAIDALPAWVPPEESGAMEGDRHSKVCDSVRSALRAYFDASGEQVYVSGEIAVYCPGEARVSPDVFVVRGATLGARDSWVVTREGRAPEWALEVIVLGDRDKDLERHVVTYAEMGFQEYFVFDVRKRRLLGYRLADPKIAMYTRIVPQRGRYRSEVLDLELVVEGEMLRLFHKTARLLDADELAEQLRDQLNDEQMQRQMAEERAADAEARTAAEAQARVAAEARAAAEAQARTDAEAELARLRAVLAQMQQTDKPTT